MIELIFQKELIWVKKVNQEKAIIVIIEKYLCNGCHYLMQKAMPFNDDAIVSIKGNYYRIHFWYMSKNDAIVLMTNSYLKDKNGIL